MSHLPFHRDTLHSMAVVLYTCQCERVKTHSTHTQSDDHYTRKQDPNV
jgi:hypothetical protein